MLTIANSFNLDGYYNHGNGEPLASVPAPKILNLELGARDLYISLVFYIVATALIKISFALTLHRIMQHRSHLLVLKLTMFVVAVMSIMYSFFCIWQCSPPGYTYQRFQDPYFLAVTEGVDPSRLNLKPRGHCVHPTIIHNANYAHSAMLIAADITLGVVLPILLLRGLNMRRRLKIVSGLLLALGSLASIATIVRMAYTHLLGARDPLYSANPVFVWSGIELSWCIVVTSCVMLKPLADKIGITQGRDSGTAPSTSWKQSPKARSDEKTIPTEAHETEGRDNIGMAETSMGDSSKAEVEKSDVDSMK